MALEFFHTYTPELVQVSFKDVIISGFAADTFIEVERDEDAFTKYVGSLNGVARSQILNGGGKVTLTLMAVAPVNYDLWNWADLDRVSGAAYGPLSIRDLNGRTRIHAEIAWIQKLPNVERGKESGTIQWVFDCADIQMLIGGNDLSP